MDWSKISNRTDEIRKSFLVCFLIFGIVCITQCVLAQTWVEDTFEDFADGTLDASGNNIYVSRNGTIRTIHRFDLNDDGYIDLLFNSSHDIWSNVPATMATVAEDRSLHSEHLAVEGSIQAEVEDLNRDGYLDVVFCPNESGQQNPRNFVTIIWGGEDGWPAHRSNGILPVNSQRAMATVDLNHDNWSDIVVLNSEAWLPNQPKGNILRIFWGGEGSFLLSNFQDVGVPGAIGITSGDFDSDGACDLAVLKSDNSIHVIWAKKSEDKTVEFETSEISLPDKKVKCITAADTNGDKYIDLVVGADNKTLLIVKGKSGRNWDEVDSILCFGASQISVGNLDGDKFPDIILTKFSARRDAGGEFAGGESSINLNILWGSRKGFDASRSSSLEALCATATAIGDLDSDGHMDVAVAIQQSEKTFDAESLIFFGKGNRSFERGKEGIPTKCAIYVTIAPAKGKQPARVIFCNRLGGTLREEVPLHLYWGGPEGFSEKRRTNIPFRSGMESSAADLNEDGFPDLISMGSLNGGQSMEEDQYAGANIFWGGAEGFDFEGRRTVIKANAVITSNVADFNRDGYLDLVLGQRESHNGDDMTEVIIFYGSEKGFDQSNRAGIPSEGSIAGNLIADFNKDRWLDIAVTTWHKDCFRIFYGSPEGFHENNQTILNVPNCDDLETADLNGDGWLDIVACPYKDPLTLHPDTGLLIFWGSPGGFKVWNAQWLPGFAPTGPAIADFDSDGYLDIFCPHYLGAGGRTRELIPSYLYWGGPEGFTTRGRSALINNSAHDALAADFNRDGLIDIAVSNHTKDGNHHTFSKVFYNDGNRFENPRIEKLPTHGTHWMWWEDMGHIYTRKWEQTYVSSTFHWKRKSREGKINHKAETKSGTKLVFYIRSASKEKSLPDAPWKKAESGRFQVKASDRYLNYKAVFISDNGDRFPVLDMVSIEIVK